MLRTHEFGGYLYGILSLKMWLLWIATVLRYLSGVLRWYYVVCGISRTTANAQSDLIKEQTKDNSHLTNSCSANLSHEKEFVKSACECGDRDGFLLRSSLHGGAGNLAYNCCLGNQDNILMLHRPETPCHIWCRCAWSEHARQRYADQLRTVWTGFLDSHMNWVADKS